jgi:hypothetical protein
MLRPGKICADTGAMIAIEWVEGNAMDDLGKGLHSRRKGELANETS